MSKQPTSQVIEIGQISFSGNITPNHWYKNIRFEKSGKPNFVAITLLSDIVYWYRPTEIRDEATGQTIEMKKKFKADFLQRSTKDFAEQFGFSKKQTNDALNFLQSNNYIIRHSRNINTNVGVCSGVQFIEIVPETIKQLQKINTLLPGGHDPSTPKSTPISPQVETYTETPTKTTSDTKKNNVRTLLPSAKKKTEPNIDYTTNLTKEQRELHDTLVAYKPQWGESVKSDAVCAWFRMKDKTPFTIDQVKDAFLCYKQDVASALEKGKEVRSMGGTMRAAMNSNRIPKNLDFEFNKNHAKIVCKDQENIELKKDYVTFKIGSASDQLNYSLPRESFISQLARIKFQIENQEE